MFNLQVHIGGDCPFRVADGHFLAAQGGSLTRFHLGGPNVGHRNIRLNFGQFQLFQLFAFGLGQFGGGGPGLVARDEILQVTHFRQYRLVGALFMQTLFFLVLQERICLSREIGQFAP